MSLRLETNIQELTFNNKKLTLGERTLIMGILNVTPDSFSDGGKFNETTRAVDHAIKMIHEGADIIDIGGESTRPGSAEVSQQEEIDRVVPVIEALNQHIKAPISIDTYKSKVAELALKSGADMVNDVWGLQREPDIAKVVAEHDVPVFAMHNQVGTEYEIDIIESMKFFFDKTIEIALKAGISEKKIILDPGIGFGKTPIQNIHVMSRLDEIKALGYPILLGTSRKSMIGKILDLPSDKRVEGTVATTVIGIMTGVEVVRVHDITENLRAALVADAIIRGYEPWTK